MDSIVLDAKSQASFWEHMFKKCVVRLGPGDDYKRRKDLLAQIGEELYCGAYSPMPVRGFLTVPKGGGVARFVPVLSYRDYAVFFGCVKAFDEKLASLAVEDTYGGWSLGGKRREFEEAQAKETFDSAFSTPLTAEELEEFGLGDIVTASMPVSAYNRWAWVDNWCQYWKLVAAKFEHTLDDGWFVMFDVANFYDTIDLPRLERQIRKECPDKVGAIDVLFYFLSTWNKHLNQYSPTTKGIPMDIIGDCSRVLANFYLTPYDAAMRRLSIEMDSHYIRFADDMVLACPDKSICQKLIFEAAEQLHRIGLNINVAKVRYFDKKDFELWWGFKILDRLSVDEQVADGMKELESIYDKPGFGRRNTALKMAITALGKREGLDKWRRWTCRQAFSSNEFLLELKENHMKSLIIISGSPSDAINNLADVIMPSPFSQPKACLLRCLESFRNHVDPEVKKAANRVLCDIQALGDPVLNMAVANMPNWKCSRRERGKRKEPTLVTSPEPAVEVAVN